MKKFPTFLDFGFFINILQTKFKQSSNKLGVEYNRQIGKEVKQ